jgi:hypothetical protein
LSHQVGRLREKFLVIQDVIPESGLILQDNVLWLGYWVWLER